MLMGERKEDEYEDMEEETTQKIKKMKIHGKGKRC